MKKVTRYSPYVVLLALLLLPLATAANDPEPPTIPLPPPVPLYGINFINSVDHPADEQQFANGRATGAQWNRWPLYWNRIETQPDQYNWEEHDKMVTADQREGLKTNAILLGTPPFYTTNLTALRDCLQANFAIAPQADWLAAQPAPCLESDDGRRTTNIQLDALRAATPAGLYDAVFADGSDIPAPGKAINPNNKWATFVYNIVNRYKPGGLLAKQSNWPSDWGITHWEMWNEPDFSIFWDGSLDDYARLLKVGYLAAKQADDSAVILFGGLANNGDQEFYGKVLDIYRQDAQAAAQNHYHDIFVTHNYSYAWKSWYYVWKARRDLIERDLNEKPIWLNESGVPAWNDYPGPVWDPTSGLRATTDEQANFILQSAFYALYAGADGLFHFQLYDGCGNQPAYTTFPPHNGELCNAEGMLISDPSKPCAGDANGLYTNPSDYICFNQHPTPESPRPSFAAFRILTQYVQGVEPYWRSRPGGDDPTDGPQEIIALYKRSTAERLVAMWSRDGNSHTAVIPAEDSQATLVFPDGTTQIITPDPADNSYRIDLPPATNRNAFWDPNLYMIGGATRILIEKSEGLPPDTTPPVITAASAQVDKQTWQSIAVSWQADDGAGRGVWDYSISVSVDGGEAQAWLTDTTQTTAVYTSEPNHTYRFFITARDRAGNRSQPRQLLTFTFELPPQAWLPLISR